MNWGVPDWRIGGDYPAARKITYHQWWWQFTRRRPDYRQDWMRWSPINRERVMSAETRYSELAAKSGDTIEVFLQTAPTDDPVGVRRKYQMSTLLDPTKEYSDMRLWMHHWSPNGLINEPRSSGMREAEWLAREFPDRPEMLARRIGVQVEEESARERAGIVHFQFDLAKPIEPQLERARRQLCGIQTEEHGAPLKRRPRQSNWAVFLRALDARDAGATYAEMAQAFWPDLHKTEWNARDAYKAACQLRDNFPI